MNGSIEDERLARYVAGEMSAAEVAALERQAAADPRLAARLRTTRAAWAGAAADPGDPIVDVDVAWQRLQARRTGPADAGRVDPQVVPLRQPGQRPEWRAASRRRTASRLRVAAGAVLVVVGGALVWEVAQPRDELLTTATGEQRAWTLRDGTSLRLGPATSLYVPRGYGSRHRTVRLDHGEAFFRVAHADAPALTVLARGALVRDVGTAFTVRALAGEDRLEVTVTEGTVWLGTAAAAPEGGLLLHGGERGRVGLADGSVTGLGAADTTAALAWTQGRLVLRDAPLSEVVLQLRRWYGLDVRFAQPRLAVLRLSAEFAGESADEVLTAIGTSLGLAWQRDGDVVTFRPDAP